MTELGFKPTQSASKVHALNHHCHASVLSFLESELLKRPHLRVTYFIFTILLVPDLSWWLKGTSNTDYSHSDSWTVHRSTDKQYNVRSQGSKCSPNAEDRATNSERASFTEEVIQARHLMLNWTKAYCRVGRMRNAFQLLKQHEQKYRGGREQTMQRNGEPFCVWL